MPRLLWRRSSWARGFSRSTGLGALVASEIASLIHPALGSSSILLRNRGRAVRDTLPVRGIMFPCPSVSAFRCYVRHVPVSVDVIIYGDVPLHVNRSVAAAPVEAAPCVSPGSPDPYRRTKADHALPHHHSSRMIVEGSMGRPPPPAVDNHRIVYRNIDDLRVRKENENLACVRVNLHAQLIACIERPLSLGAPPQLLNGCHDLLLLCQKRVSQLLRPVNSFGHHL